MTGSEVSQSGERRFPFTKRKLERLPLPTSGRVEYHDAIELAQAHGGRLSSIRDWASKHAGRVARISGLLHLVRHHHLDEPWTQSICPEDVSMAVPLAGCGESLSAGRL